MDKNKLQLQYLKFIILSQLLLECNETLAETKQYKQSLKNKLNGLNLDLEGIVKTEFMTIYNTDAEATTNILRNINELIYKLTDATVDELVFINSIIDKCKNDKSWFLENAETEFLKLNNIK